jgi:stearoyl-CoA desaturase (delta-9 desaturase)
MAPFRFVRHDPEGVTRLDPAKVARFALWHALLLCAPFAWRFPPLLAAAFLSWWCMGLGLSVALHRGLIHRAFAMGKTTERVLVTLGTLNGLGGPIGLSRMHHLRDFHQNRPTCPRYFGYRHGFFEAMGFALVFRFEPVSTEGVTAVWREVLDDPYYQGLERWGFVLQVPVALAFFVAFGWPGIVWGVGVRMALTQDGFWFVHYVSHALPPTSTRQPFGIDGASEEGRNVWWLALPSLGESWHNNHHAYPTSARMGLTDDQSDLGYSLIRVLERLGLVWGVVLPAALPLRATARRREAVATG